jgi:hypothetical protein
LTNDESKWPGVDLAYDLARDSYSVAYQRLDNINGRIQSLLTYAATVTFAAPVIVRSIEEQPDFESPWFVAAMVFFVINGLAGPVALIAGSVQAVSPKVVYEKWLEFSPWEFKKTAVYWAAEHFDMNARLVNRKGHAATAMVAVLHAEAVCLLVWGAGQF